MQSTKEGKKQCQGFTTGVARVRDFQRNRGRVCEAADELLRDMPAAHHLEVEGEVLRWSLGA
jgi:hypothetical protein